MEYKIIRAKRKTICITVKTDLTVEVRAPEKMKLSDIESFVYSKQRWIEKAVERMESAKPADFTYGSTIPFNGLELAVTASKQKRPTISEGMLLVPEGLTENELKNKTVEFYKAQAKRILPGKVKKFSAETGIKYSSLLINSAKTHWGSCTSDRLHLSCFLMAAPEEIIDYVIIHELAHTVHHNHSAAFWALVEKHCPDYIQKRNELKALAVKISFLN